MIARWFTLWASAVVCGLFWGWAARKVGVSGVPLGAVIATAGFCGVFVVALVMGSGQD